MIHLEALIIEKNTGRDGGGIVNFPGGAVHMNGSVTVRDNVARGKGNASGFGGGIVNSGELMFTNDNRVISNEAKGKDADGGGIWNNGQITGAADISDNKPNDCVDAQSGTGCLA